MDNTLFKTIPLETAMEYHSFAAERGRNAGKIQEHKRIMDILKKHHLYEAILVIKKSDEQAS